MMNKETLEEAAYQARRDYQDEVGKDGMNECIMLDAMKIQKGFELGGKWQAERTYSDEEVSELVYNIIGEYGKHYGIMIDGAKLNELFEQFKK